MPTDIDSLVRRYIDGYLEGDPEKIVSCFWPEIVIVTPDTPISGYDNHLRRLQTYVDKTDNIEYEFLARLDDIGFFSMRATMTIGNQHLPFHFSCLTEKRRDKVKFIYLHLSPYSSQEGPPYAWIARKLAAMEHLSNEMEQTTLRLEQENQELRRRNDRSNNMIATGRIEALHLGGNPPMLRLRGGVINQSFYIDRRLLAECHLKTGMDIRVKLSAPVPNDGGRKPTKYWKIFELEIIGVNK